MTNVGILTRHCYPNYGSFLQTLGLQHALETSGAATKVLDYIPPGDSTWTLAPAGLRESSLRHSAVGRAAYLLAQTPNLALMSKMFRKSQRRKLKLSESSRDRAGLKTSAMDLEKIVVGSDQVWNKIHGEINWDYFLEWTNDLSARHSYAGSFGGAPDSENLDRIVSRLQNFKTLSVREKTSARILNGAGLDARVDVDPVFLPGRRFWEDQSAEGKAPRTKYLLVYQLHNTPNFRLTVERLSRKHRLPVRTVTADLRQVLRTNASDYLATPETFLALFRDAEHIVTDSFHGTAFAMIFEKPVEIVLPEKNAARITDLLQTAGLHDGEPEGYKNRIVLDTYSEQALRERLASARDESMSYIQQMVGT